MQQPVYSSPPSRQSGQINISYGQGGMVQPHHLQSQHIHHAQVSSVPQRIVSPQPIQQQPRVISSQAVYMPEAPQAQSISM